MTDCGKGLRKDQDGPSASVDSFDPFALPFDQLTGRQVYEILKARARVFSLEQGIRYLDMDDVDYSACHVFLTDRLGEVLAYGRLYRQEDDEPGTIRLGRVLTIRHGHGLGRRLMEVILTAAKEKMGGRRIVLDAQKSAIGFYRVCGFSIKSGEFLEAGIVHQVMEKDLSMMDDR